MLGFTSFYCVLSGISVCIFFLCLLALYIILYYLWMLSVIALLYVKSFFIFMQFEHLKGEKFSSQLK